jgi:alpha-galactosidase
MGISYDQQLRVFKLDTKNTSYVMGLVDEPSYLGHMYYGKKIQDSALFHLLRIDEPPFIPSVNARDKVSFLDCFPMEISPGGLGDFRENSLLVSDAEGYCGCELTYLSHQILKGKPGLEGLPATFGDEATTETLIITLFDPHLKLTVDLLYSVFEDVDAIIRSLRITNSSDSPIVLNKVLSMCMDMDNLNFDWLSLHGSWARERVMQRQPVGLGRQNVGSFRGETSHQEHGFIALLEKTATHDQGQVYGFHFVYSGNFIAQVELNQFQQVRTTMGIHPQGFSWTLEAGQSFTAPEVVLVYSDAGLNKMSHCFHDLYRNHLIRSPYKDMKRPILINNWEATYFDFDTDKLLAIAKEAASKGIEMLVMDDGWFGNRSDDNRALGDWFVNEDKLKGGLKALVDQVNAHGLQFGIWFEPEMVSPDSDLFRAHPDWAIQIPNRQGSLCRNQYVLDLSNAEVKDYIFERLETILSSANIAYVKWDMNRQLTDMGSTTLARGQQGELYHRYVLGVYELQERLIQRFPSLLLENCSGGGARFDPGMLYYSPQIWTSDDTDAIERLAIQEGTALIYPLSSMGAHVSDCPNHTVGRITPFETRGYVALAGTFGYELDITKIPEADVNMIPEQVALYHQHNDLIRTGDYYRLNSYRENHRFDAWQVIAKDASETLVTYIQVLSEANTHSRRLYLKGLEVDSLYHIVGTNLSLTGGALMYSGLPLPKLHGDFKGKLIHIQKR